MHPISRFVSIIGVVGLVGAGWLAAPAAAQPETPTGTPAAGEPTLLTGVRFQPDALPPGPVDLRLRLFEVTPGTREPFPDSPFTTPHIALIYVLSGELGVVRVSPAALAGRELTLSAGGSANVVLGSGDAIDVRNDGPDPVRFLHAAIYAGGAPTGPIAAAFRLVDEALFPAALTLAPANVSALALGRVMLDPGEALPARSEWHQGKEQDLAILALPIVAEAKAAVGTDPTALERSPDGETRNAAGTPQETYVLIVLIVQTPATPAAGTPSA